MPTFFIFWLLFFSIFVIIVFSILLSLGISGLIPLDISMIFISYVFFAFLLFYLGIELVLTLIGLMIFQSLSNYETGAYRLDKKATTSFSSKRKAYKEITVFFLKVLLTSVAKRLLLMFKYFTASF